MANLREALAATAIASLEWSEERERAVDRVAASGRASKLGLQIWKARYMYESKAYQDARRGLVALFSERYRSKVSFIAEKVVDEVLSEFMGPACSACLGARELIVGELRVVCETCAGSGLRMYSDFERARKMALSLRDVRLLGRKMAWLASELGSLDRSVNSIIAAELERI